MAEFQGTRNLIKAKISENKASDKGRISGSRESDKEFQGTRNLIKEDFREPGI